MTEPLFEGYEPEGAAGDAQLSPDRRLTLRQQADVRKGLHPLNHGPLHDQADRSASKDDGARRPLTCGTCVNRQSFVWKSGSYPKCVAFDRVFVKHSAATDVRAWWPACPRYLPAGSWSSNTTGEN